jgi:serine/threonine-protein phosphatase 2A regulatory subunit B
LFSHCSSLFSSLDKTIKLWKIGPKLKYSPRAVNHFQQYQQIAFPSVDYSGSAAADLSASSLSNETELLHATTKRIFANAHAYHINSLALNSDTETFISADDLRVNMWKIENSDTTFSK